MICDRCHKNSRDLFPLLYNNDDELLLCEKCWGEEETRADYEYERLKDIRRHND